MSTDLTVIVTAHDETAVCGPTMRAADLAVEAARQRGYTLETIIGLDAPTEATSAYFHQTLFDHWERRVVRERGSLRGAVAAESDGRFLAFLSADDLCSENWLAEGVATLDAAAGQGERAVAHPELSVVFDGQKQVHVNIDQGSPLFTSHYLCFRDYYDSPCIAPREALETPYRDVEFTVETMSTGWRHVVVRDTIIFQRRRQLPSDTDRDGRASLVRVLPAMSIDRIRDLGSVRR
jgi:hypothetical protein